jgi:hypothetical protein
MQSLMLVEALLSVVEPSGQRTHAKLRLLPS